MAPVPAGYQDRYGTIVAAQTARMKREGKSPGAANEAAKKMADAAIEHLKAKNKS